MKGRSELCYRKILLKIKEVVPAFRVFSIITDSNRNIHTAVTNVFPKVKTSISLYCYQKVKKYNYYNLLLSMCLKYIHSIINILINLHY